MKRLMARVPTAGLMLRRTSEKNRVRSLTLLLIAIATAAAVAAPALSDPNIDSWPYTHSHCPASNSDRVDPVNFVFWGWATIENGTRGRVTDQVTYHTTPPWIELGGSTQYFGEHSTGNCFKMTTQQASGNWWESRYHIRYHPITNQDPGWGWLTVGDAHHENVTCWPPDHAIDQNGPGGSGFDQGRRHLRQMMQGTYHPWTSFYWGNTQKFTQCTGNAASSDGYTVFMYIHNWQD